MAVPGALISGLSIYFIFSYLFIPFKVTIPISVIISLLIFGLTKYYAADTSSSNGTSSNSSICSGSTNLTTAATVIGSVDDISITKRSVLGYVVSTQSKIDDNQVRGKEERSKRSTEKKINLTHILFVVGYIVALLIVVIGSFSSTLFRPNIEEIEALKLFVPWQQQFNSIDTIIKLGAAIALSFFLPGYALVCSVLLKEEKGIESNSSNNSIATQPPRLQHLRSKALLKVLLGYILSVFITGFTGYIVASFGMPVSGINIILPLVIIYAIILIVFVLQTKTLLNNKKIIKFNLNLFFKSNFKAIPLLFIRKNNNNPTKSISPEIILVFVCLFALLVLSTYYLYGGIIIGDQWFHHGRALLFISGTFRDIANSAQDDLYPPFLSAFLAAFISLSDNPSVNAYASISFLNIMPVLAFYYFFTRWFGINNSSSNNNSNTSSKHDSNSKNPKPRRLQRDAALLASVLFMLSGGLGWVYALSIASDTSSALHHPVITSYASSLELLHLASVKTDDIVAPSNFNLVAHPDFSTGLQLIVLPVGFALLGLLKEEKGGGGEQIKNQKRKYSSKIKYFVIVTLISLLGILSHDEIYLFIIIVSIIPIIFGLPKKHFVYAAFLAAIAITFFVDRIYLENYFTSTLIFGVPLLYLSFLFVGFTWALYVSKTYFSKFVSTRKVWYSTYKFSVFNRLLKKSVDRESSSSYSLRFRIKIAIGIAVVLVVAYWYVFTFIVWAEVPPEVVRSLTFGPYLNVPWYLFPMKLGVTGLIGLAFVLSYLFKKFQKEVFVFGIITVIALFAGTHYDEHRTSKYIMLGMVGFASLLIYRIISKIVITKTTTQKIASSSPLPSFEARVENKKNKQRTQFKAPLICGLIIGSVITLSSISVLLFIGYHASAVETYNFKLALARRDFPLSSEINMFRFLDSNNLTYSKIYNIMPVPEQGTNQALTVKRLQGFTGLPQNMLQKAAAALDASTLEGFYDLLNSSNSQFIILQKKYFNTAINGFSSDIIRFALENFQKIYHDANYVILKVPHVVSAASSKSDVALIYQKNTYSLLPSISSAKMLFYNNDSFRKIGSNKFIKVETGSENVIFYGDRKTSTLWSKVIPNKNTSYIESTFRVIAENKTKNHCGIAWDDGHNKYYTRLMKHTLVTSQISANKTMPLSPIYTNNGSNSIRESSLIRNQDIIREKGVWYTLKIAFLKDSINIYIDNLLKQKISRFLFENGLIVKVGISCSNSIGEFEPIKIGRIYDLSDRYNQKEIYYHNYYPLNALALSNIRYDIFPDNDYSAFSKRNIILAFDPTDNYEVARYLEYAKRGGTLIVFNTDNKFQGGFSKLLSIQPGNTSKFEGILASDKESQQPLKIFGNTTYIESKDTNISSLSFYVNKKNEIVSPLAIQKKYQGGNIIFINAGGYFDAIFTHPDQYFSSLSNFPKLIGLQSNNNYMKVNSSNSVLTQLPLQYTGDLMMEGQTMVKSSSLSLTNGSDDVTFYADHVNVTTDKQEDNNKTTSNRNSREHSLSAKPSFENVMIKNLKLSGSYEAIINFIGPLHLPLPLSQDHYIAMSVPNGFDMTVKLLDGANAEFTYGNYTHYYNNNQEIHFQKIKSAIPGSTFISILTKSPEIIMYGKASLNQLLADKSVPINLTGKINAKVDRTIYYDIKHLHNLGYLTYLKWINGEEKRTPSTVEFVLPGSLKKEEADGKWKEIIFFDASITTKLLNVFFVMTVLGVWALWPKMKIKMKLK